MTPLGREVNAAQVEPRSVDWTWYPRLPAAHLTLVAARGGTGKGLLCAHLAGVITTGRVWPDGGEGGPPGQVLWCEAEDPLEEAVVPRLMAAYADRRRVTIVDRERYYALYAGEAGAAALRQYIQASGVRLVVLSPLLSFLHDLQDKNDEMAVREALARLQGAIAGTQCSIVGITHTNKNGDLAAIERVLGAVAFTNYVRCVLMAAPEDDQNRFRLVHAKHNLSVRSADLVYETVLCEGCDPRSQYVGLRWNTADHDVESESVLDRKKAAKPSAGQWLVRFLQKHGETEYGVIKEEALRAGYGEEALRKAAYRAGARIQYRRDGYQGSFTWRYE